MSEFKQRLDQAFSIGRKEIAEAASLSNRFTQQNFVGVENSPAYQAIAQMRELFEQLNPQRHGDLLQHNKLFGLIPLPFANKLKRYLRRYQSAERQLSGLQHEILQAKDEVAKDVAAMGVSRQQLWAALEKLEAVSFFISALDQRLSLEIDVLTAVDPLRAKALAQEVLYYVRQNLGDIQATQALTINAYHVLGELRKTGRETMNGCDRVATLGMAALSVAVTLARATGNQVATMQMVSGAKQSIEALISQTSQALGQHVDMTTQFANEPIVGVKTLQQMFDQTFLAMDKLDQFRSDALQTMKTNQAMLTQELMRAKERLTQSELAKPTETSGIHL
jgi:uncharacterized protein YaaN involved in tellurite resistance